MEPDILAVVGADTGVEGGSGFRVGRHVDLLRFAKGLLVMGRVVTLGCRQHPIPGRWSAEVTAALFIKAKLPIIKPRLPLILMDEGVDPADCGDVPSQP